MKICTDCRRTLPENEFYKTKRHKDGLSYQCKDCRREYNQGYNQAHKKERIEKKSIKKNIIRIIGKKSEHMFDLRMEKKLMQEAKQKGHEI